jgi:protein-tyrosine phosphatase
MSRSPAMLCSYLMQKFALSFEDAYRLIKQRRPIVEINEGFQKELKEYEKMLNKK